MIQSTLTNKKTYIMKILSLELSGFTRLSLNQIEHFYMDLNSPIQLILGTNGSGKSSLLQELTAMPASQYDYKKGGYKIIRIMQGSTIYCLKSDFKIGQKHSFFNETTATEMNPGGTVSVQKDLVKQYFNMSLDMRELMQGGRGFTKMSVSDRRYWFTKLNDTSYDYAINVYNKLKEKARDANGALKNAKKRLVSESAQLMDKSEQDKLNAVFHELHNTLESLQKDRASPVKSSIEELESARNALFDQLSKLSMYVHRTKQELNSQYRGLNVDQLLELLGKMDALMDTEQASLKDYTGLYAQLEDKVNTIKQTSQTNLVGLKKSESDIEAEIKELLSTLKIVKDYSLYSHEQSRIATNLVTTIENVFIQLPSNVDKRFSRNNLQDQTNLLNKRQSELETLNQQLMRVDAYIANQEEKKNHDELNCPNCNHKWILGFNPQGFEKAKSARVTFMEEKEKLLKSMEAINSEIEAIKEYSTLYKDYSSLVSSYGCFKEFWDYIERDNMVQSNPKAVINSFQVYLQDIQSSLKVLDHHSKLSEILKLIALSESVKDSDTAAVLEQASKLQQRIEQCTLNLTQYRQDKVKLQKHLDSVRKVLSLGQNIEELVDHVIQNSDTSVQWYRCAAHDAVIRDVQVELAVKQKALADLRVKQALIDDLESQIVILDREEQGYKMLLSELSPVDGLIAEGMTGFIKVFVKQMNQIIAKIWNYPLEIQSCALQEGEAVDLDYQFPFVVQSDTREDVSKGSSAMCEIFDFAFKVVASRYISSESIPLYLDELGRAMDVEHKMKVIEYVKNLSDKHIFSQIFLISHDILQYGALSNTDICVLCDANIVLPKDCTFNKHVLMN